MIKGINMINADNLLKQCAPFEEISRITGWTHQQIIDYVDSIFRNENPRVVSENFAYFCWGRTKDEMFDDNNISRLINDEIIRQQIESLKKDNERYQKVKSLKK